MTAAKVKRALFLAVPFVLGALAGVIFAAALWLGWTMECVGRADQERGE